MFRRFVPLAIAFYIGATAAFLVPFTSPLAAPLSALAHVVAGR